MLALRDLLIAGGLGMIFVAVNVSSRLNIRTAISRVLTNTATIHIKNSTSENGEHPF